MSDAKTVFTVSATETLPEKGEGRIILSDINGTLLLNKVGGGHLVNDALVAFYVAAEKRGYKVVLHSTTEQSMMVFDLLARRNPAFKAFMDGRDADYPISSKGETENGKNAILTVDDEHGSTYHSHAPNQWEPKDPRITATMTAWGELAPVSAPSVVPSRLPDGIKL